MGMFAAGTMHGSGKYAWADGTSFEGTFVANCISGNGKYSWSDGSTYEGGVERGVRHGRGVLQLVNAAGARYEGNWKDGKRDGHGVLWYHGAESESRYEGQWKDGLRHGNGVMVYPSGNRYDGEWQNDLKHGEGTMQWNTTDEVYTGTWSEGKQSGRGEHIWLGQRTKVGQTQRQMCNRYVGYWKNGLRHGGGVFYFANGSRYVGDFFENMKHGNGVYTFPDGRVYEGPFKDDRMAFNDGSLEEKVATRGPVKVPAGRKKKSRKSKSSDGSSGSSSGPSIPLAGVTRNVHLNIADLLDGLPPTELLAQRRGVDKVIMRWNTQLKDIYSYYSTIGEDFDPNNFTMRASQLWMLAKDCGLLSQSINITRINRIVTEVRLQLAQAVALSRRRREAAEKGVPVDLATPIDDRAYMEVEEDIHSPTRPILFREFVEALVRIANEREAVPESAEEASAAPTAPTAARRTSTRLPLPTGPRPRPPPRLRLSLRRCSSARPAHSCPHGAGC